jgi:hypothetical protein
MTPTFRIKYRKETLLVLPSFVNHLRESFLPAKESDPLQYEQVRKKYLKVEVTDISHLSYPLEVYWNVLNYT